MTNRDKFNKISNAKLADILSRTLGADTCKFCCYAKEKCLGKSCTEGIEVWLNASCEPKNPPADNEQQEAIPPEVKADLKKAAYEIIGECKKKYPIDCEYCRYGDHIGICCFERKPITWVLDTVKLLYRS